MKKTNHPNNDIQKPKDSACDGAFLSSLSELSASDFPSTAKKGDAKKRRQKIIYNCLLVLFAGLFVFSGVSLWGNVSDYMKAERIYDELKQIWNESGEELDSSRFLSQSVCLRPMAPLNTGGGSLPEAEETKPTANEHLLILTKLNRLYALNSDTYGWIKIDGTVIDYPLVQGPDNDYYLRRDFYKNYLNNGSIYVHYKNSKSILENQNTVIFGHNMDDGSMFNNVHLFADKDFFEKTLITITTRDGVFVYKPFSVHKPLSSDSYYHTSFSSSKYLGFLKGLQEKSFVKNDLLLTDISKIITLSTCVDTILQSKYRFALHAKLISYTSPDGTVIDYEALEREYLESLPPEQPLPEESLPESMPESTPESTPSADITQNA